jgi:hypothetical protein
LEKASFPFVFFIAYLSNLTHHPSIRYIDLCLIRGTFMGFTAQKLKVFAAWGILKLLHVGIVAETCQANDILENNRLTF